MLRTKGGPEMRPRDLPHPNFLTNSLLLRNLLITASELPPDNERAIHGAKISTIKWAKRASLFEKLATEESAVRGSKFKNVS